MQNTDIQIVNYKPEHSEKVKALSLHWLNKYGLAEEYDLNQLNNLQKEVIDKGGFIWVAQIGEEIVGTIALLHYENEAEISKLGVSEAHQGKNIGNHLLYFLIEKAKELAYKKIILYSNHQLKSALHLYEKFGFQYIAVDEASKEKFTTADIKMELYL